MTTFTARLLSGSTNGKNIKIAANATPGTLVHTAVAGTSSIDEVTIEVTNTSSVGVKVTIEWGEATAPDGNIEATIPPEAGPIKIIDRWRIQNGLEVRAFAATQNVLVVNGFVDRIA